MDMNEKQAITDAMSILKAEPSRDSDHREQLAVLVASVKAKDIIGVSLTRDQVKRLSSQDVEKYFKRYEAPLSSKTWLIHVFSSHVKHWLFFYLLMRENSLRT